MRTITKYIEAGGSLLLTTSSGGDFNYGRDKGSIRNLSRITGVRKYWWGELFTNNKKMFLKTPEDLILNKFEDHPIFNGINKLLLSDCTFLKTSENMPELFVLNTEDNIYYRDFNDYEEIEIEPSPIIVINGNAGRGRVISIGSTFFMTDHPQYGVEIFDNKKFFKNIVSWLLHKC